MNPPNTSLSISNVTCTAKISVLIIWKKKHWSNTTLSLIGKSLNYKYKYKKAKYLPTVHHNTKHHQTAKNMLWWVNPVINDAFRTESWWYPDLDARSCGGTQPVSVGTEAERVDHVTTVQRVQMLAFIQVPEHGLSILKTENDKDIKHNEDTELHEIMQKKSISQSLALKMKFKWFWPLSWQKINSKTDSTGLHQGFTNF